MKDRFPAMSAIYPYAPTHCCGVPIDVMRKAVSKAINKALFESTGYMKITPVSYEDRTRARELIEFRNRVLAREDP